MQRPVVPISPPIRQGDSSRLVLECRVTGGGLLTPVVLAIDLGCELCHGLPIVRCLRFALLRLGIHRLPLCSWYALATATMDTVLCRFFCCLCFPEPTHRLPFPGLCFPSAHLNCDNSIL
jgi:hypothetical protein